MAQWLHARRSAPPAAGSHRTTKAARAGGGGPRAQAGGWLGEGGTRPPARQHPASSARGTQGRRCWLAMAARPASRLCLAGGEQSPASPAPRSHASPPRCLGTGRWGRWQPGHWGVGVPRPPRWHWGVKGCATATATAPSLTSFSSLSYALGMPRQCPYPEKPHQVLAVDAKHADPSRCHSPGGASTRGAPRAPHKGLGSGAGRG